MIHPQPLIRRLWRCRMIHVRIIEHNRQTQIQNNNITLHCRQVCVDLTQHATELLIHSLVISRLDYGNGLLYGVPDKLLDKLQRVQNVAARVVVKASRYDHITPILKSLHWLPIRYRTEYKLLLLTFKALHHLAPSYLTDLLQLYRPTRTL